MEYETNLTSKSIFPFQIVSKFQKKVNEKTNDGRKLTKYSYNDYQSKHADKVIFIEFYRNQSKVNINKNLNSLKLKIVK